MRCANCLPRRCCNAWGLGSPEHGLPTGGECVHTPRLSAWWGGAALCVIAAVLSIAVRRTRDGGLISRTEDPEPEPVPVVD